MHICMCYSCWVFPLGFREGAKGGGGVRKPVHGACRCACTCAMHVAKCTTCSGQKNFCSRSLLLELLILFVAARQLLIMPPKNNDKDLQLVPASKKRGRPAAELVSDDPQAMRKSISRMLTSLKYKADPMKNKKKDGMEDAQKVLAAAWDIFLALLPFQSCCKYKKRIYISSRGLQPNHR